MSTFQPVALDQWIENILDTHPHAQQFLREHGIVCVMCGEPVWGSLGDQMEEKGFDDEAKEKLLAELNTWLQQKESE